MPDLQEAGTGPASRPALAEASFLAPVWSPSRTPSRPTHPFLTHGHRKPRWNQLDGHTPIPFYTSPPSPPKGLSQNGPPILLRGGPCSVCVPCTRLRAECVRWLFVCAQV